MFFVVAEIHNTGYIIGEFSTFEEANMEQSRIFSLSFEYSYQEIHKVNTNLKGYKSYKIKNGDYIRHCKAVTAGGVYNVYTIEINNTYPSIALFIKDREFQTKLFSREDLNKIEDDYLK